MSRVRALVLALPLAATAAAGAAIDTSKSGTYESGDWAYAFTIRAKGSRSERRHGELRFEGWAVEKLMEVKLYDKVKTPWGLMQFFGPKARYNSGWLSKTTYDHPLRKEGRLLPTPKPGAAAEAVKRPVEVTFSGGDRTVEARCGQTIRVSLPGNPTTGFTWVLKKTKGDSVTQEGKLAFQKSPAAEGMVGVGGMFVATFKAAKQGQTIFLMEYKRPWEKKDPARACVVRFEIAASPQDQPEAK